jgi:hypothetical protein
MGEVIYRLDLDASLDPSPVLPALIWAEGIAAPRPTEEAPAFLTEILTQAVTTGEEFVPAALRKRVRKMLRHGKYHASGRGKPASEFLLRAALAGSFPLLLRRGRPEESYTFNRSGQTIDLQDL